jgi:hypothetical protein
MSDLTPAAVEHLYPVLMILGAAISAVITLLGIAWAGFIWLRGQITSVAQALVSPLAERVALVEKTADAAHRRIDEWMGKRT